MRKRIFFLLTIVSVACMVGFPAGAPPNAVHAAETGDETVFFPLVTFVEPIKLFFPLVSFIEPHLFDDFEDEDPEWEFLRLKDPTDGFFEHLNGKYAVHIQDNSALMVATPGWRPRADFKLEVDGRHLAPDKKSFNGLGLAFDATDDWSGFNSLILAAGSAQHFWALVQFERVSHDRYHAPRLSNNGKYRGGPSSMRSGTGTNRLMVVRIGNTIKPYCNGAGLPVGDGRRYVTEDKLGPNGLVGVVVTSYEFGWGEIDFDNFELTPLYGENPDEYRPEGAQEAVEESGTPLLLDLP